MSLKDTWSERKRKGKKIEIRSHTRIRKTNNTLQPYVYVAHMGTRTKKKNKIKNLWKKNYTTLGRKNIKQLSFIFRNMRITCLPIQNWHISIHLCWFSFYLCCYFNILLLFVLSTLFPKTCYCGVFKLIILQKRRNKIAETKTVR